MNKEYFNFIKRFKLLIKKQPNLIVITLSNIFTMRLIGNKTHGDLAEIAISEFINQYMYDFKSIHVGKDLYRAKSKEEDITIINEIDKTKFPVSLKAYGNGPLQLSTDKDFLMFPFLETYGDVIDKKEDIQEIFSSEAFNHFSDINVLPLIYDEKKQECNIMVFDIKKAKNEVNLIKKEKAGNGRKHPVYKFFDKDNNYICEVRYGGANANALQRGLWTNTKLANDFFISVTDGWIKYSHNKTLVKLFSNALISRENGHKEAIKIIEKDIQKLREGK